MVIQSGPRFHTRFPTRNSWIWWEGVQERKTSPTRSYLLMRWERIHVAGSPYESHVLSPAQSQSSKQQTFGLASGVYSLHWICGFQRLIPRRQKRKGGETHNWDPASDWQNRHDGFRAGCLWEESLEWLIVMLQPWYPFWREIEMPSLAEDEWVYGWKIWGTIRNWPWCNIFEISLWILPKKDRNKYELNIN